MNLAETVARLRQAMSAHESAALLIVEDLGLGPTVAASAVTTAEACTVAARSLSVLLLEIEKTPEYGRLRKKAP